MPSKRFRIKVHVSDIAPGGERDVLRILLESDAGEPKELFLWSDPDGTWSGVTLIAGLRSVIKEIEEQEGPPVPFKMVPDAA